MRELQIENDNDKNAIDKYINKPQRRTRSLMAITFYVPRNDAF
jgi:hypothetical protein